MAIPEVIFVYCRSEKETIPQYRRFLLRRHVGAARREEATQGLSLERLFDAIYGTLWVRYPSTLFPIKLRPDREPDPFHGYCIPDHGECGADDCDRDHTDDWWALGWTD